MFKIFIYIFIFECKPEVGMVYNRRVIFHVSLTDDLRTEPSSAAEPDVLANVLNSIVLCICHNEWFQIIVQNDIQDKENIKRKHKAQF